jgi:peptidoglycan/LPS O-acetylase OafA/YrhL
MGTDDLLPPPFQRLRQRAGLIDCLKAFASNLIVLHHLAFYGPLSDHAHPLLPGVIDWLADEARIVVQLFLVVGGFLAARSLSAPRDGEHPMAAVQRRFAKLVPPYFAAVLFAVVASALARAMMTHDAIPAAPTVKQLLAHALLLQDVVGQPSLSAGLWYIAIDFQLFACMAVLLWLARAAGRRAAAWTAPVLVMAMCALSLLHINRDAEWDVWAPYFFGSYGLGALAMWAAHEHTGGRLRRLLLCALIALPAAALALDFRSRIALASGAALLLAAGARFGFMHVGARSRAVAFLSRISYAVLLVHFPVCLLVSAVFVHVAPDTPAVQAFGMLLAWGSSIAAAAAFHRWVEIPLGRFIGRPRIERRHAVRSALAAPAPGRAAQ